jgi:hypothetical protein
MSQNLETREAQEVQEAQGAREKRDIQEAPEKTVTNQTLLLWCGAVIVEIFVIAHLMQSALVLLAGVILISPLRAAMNWPAPPADEPTENKPASGAAHQ